jgi:hypothetical protein
MLLSPFVTAVVQPVGRSRGTSPSWIRWRHPDEEAASCSAVVQVEAVSSFSVFAQPAGHVENRRRSVPRLMIWIAPAET